jgi:hypothetical protein
LNVTDHVVDEKLEEELAKMADVVIPPIPVALEGGRSKVLTGVTGEYYVAAELSRRGYIASITLRNTKGVDVLCSNTDASKSVGIQVKARTGMQRSWILSQKGEDYYADTLFYVFVNISENPKQHPEFTIVPSKVVADYIRSHHAAWLAGTKKDGEPRKDSTMRKFSDLEEHYLGRWDLLGLD